MRYKLLVNIGDGYGFQELAGNRMQSKAEIESWIQNKSSEEGGIHWRDGYRFRFKSHAAEYKWVWIKNGTEVQK